MPPPISDSIDRQHCGALGGGERAAERVVEKVMAEEACCLGVWCDPAATSLLSGELACVKARQHCCDVNGHSSP